MSHLEKDIEIMHDLLAIQQERISVYQLFMKYPVNDETVYKLFQWIVDRTRDRLFELRSHNPAACEPAGRTERKGEIYNNWPGMQYFGYDCSPADIYSCCECNEELMANAYQQALVSKEEIGPELQDLLTEQLQLVQRSFEYIRVQKEKPLEPLATMEERIPFSREFTYESYAYS